MVAWCVKNVMRKAELFYALCFMPHALLFTVRERGIGGLVE